jgi:TRAP-type C4-dicarboxylate transport system permease large subunit
VRAALYTVCGIINFSVEDYTKESLPFRAAVILELAILVFLLGVMLRFLI